MQNLLENMFCFLSTALMPDAPMLIMGKNMVSFHYIAEEWLMQLKNTLYCILSRNRIY